MLMAPRPRPETVRFPVKRARNVAGRTNENGTHDDAKPAGRTPMSRLSPSRLLTALLCAGLTLSAAAQDKDVRLPDLGSSANALISPQEAQDYGAAMLRQMRA